MLNLVKFRDVVWGPGPSVGLPWILPNHIAHLYNHDSHIPVLRRRRLPSKRWNYIQISRHTLSVGSTDTLPQSTGRCEGLLQIQLNSRQVHRNKQKDMAK